MIHEPALCRLELVDPDGLHSNIVIEARARGAGFSVRFWHDESNPDGIEIGATTEPYSARALARLMLEHGVGSRIDEGIAWYPLVSVTGERGVAAHVLRQAFVLVGNSGGEVMELPDAKFDAVAEFAGDMADFDDPHLLECILSNARDFDFDLPAMLRHYGLAAGRSNLRELYAAREREAEQQVDEWQAPLDPFDDHITWIVEAFSVPLRPYRVTWPGGSELRKIFALRFYLQNYAPAHGRLPTGRVTIPAGTIRHLGDYPAFDVDIEALIADAARLGAPVSKTYRLPRRKRARFFRRQIAALSLAFGKGRFATPEGLKARDRRDSMSSFLGKYVTDHEHLPRGTLRTHPRDTPLHLGTNMGEVDFDALSRMAGGSNAIEVPVHWRDASAP
jgi:hypothetical protein